MAPDKIGALAEVVQKFVQSRAGEYFMRGIGDWEEKLARRINNDRRLPDYDKIDQVVLEFLVNHYESDLHNTQGESWDVGDP